MDAVPNGFKSETVLDQQIVFTVEQLQKCLKAFHPVTPAPFSGAYYRKTDSFAHQ